MRNNNDNYTSKYEKIIFANNIDENNSGIFNGVIKNHNYDFTVFFTNKNRNTGADRSKQGTVPLNWPSSNWGENVKNIWFEGQRLNRFIGVDQNNYITRIGGHIVRLTFDYDTGLLGLIDINKLDSFSLIEVSYIGLNQQEFRAHPTNDTRSISDETQRVVNEEIVINAIDNRFSLTFEFNVPTPSASSDQLLYNASFILPTIDLTTNTIKNIQLENIEHLGLSTNNPNDKTKAQFKYNYKILYDTYNNDNGGANNSNRIYKFVSAYDTTKCVILNNLNLVLNPTQFLVYYNRYIAGDKLFDFNEINGNNTTEEYYVKIDPNLVHIYSYPQSYNKRLLYVKVMSSNINVATINNKATEYIPVDSANQLFQLTVKKPDDNTYNESKITVSLVHKDGNNNDYTYNACGEYSFKITTKGKENIMLYYYGYLDPTTTNIEQYLKSYAEFKKNSLIYDWKQNGIGGEQSFTNDMNKKFYFAIPTFDKDNIHIKWDSFTKEYSDKHYNMINGGFVKLTENKIYKNIEFTVYRYDNINGKFYGKIQKDN